MPSRHVKVAKGGRIVIPAEFREALGVGVGDNVVIELKDDELRLRSRRANIRRVQEMVRKYIPDEGRLLSEELIAERRREAAREAEEE